MRQETLNYLSRDTNCQGCLFYNPELKTKQPAVIVTHAWRGQDDFAREKAKALAELGYLGFAADLYGNGVTADTNEAALELMAPLFLDRQLLQDRITAAYETMLRHPLVDPKRIGIIGFCFGGLTAIELLRSGADIRGAVSFHGVLGSSMGNKKAATLPIAKKVQGALLILHGNEDPLVTSEDIVNLQTELTQAKVDWQMHIYSHTVHAFTNPEVHEFSSGLSFNPKANIRSWRAMRNFFGEMFK